MGLIVSNNTESVKGLEFEKGLESKKGHVGPFHL